jgi:hypothetical protein
MELSKLRCPASPIFQLGPIFPKNLTRKNQIMPFLQDFDIKKTLIFCKMNVFYIKNKPILTFFRAKTVTDSNFHRYNIAEWVLFLGGRVFFVLKFFQKSRSLRQRSIRSCYNFNPHIYLWVTGVKQLLIF